jgi:hypothetical protein
VGQDAAGRGNFHHHIIDDPALAGKDVARFDLLRAEASGAFDPERPAG